MSEQTSEVEVEGKVDFVVDHEFSGHGLITGILYYPRKKMIVSCSHDLTVSVWTLKKTRWKAQKCLAIFKEHIGRTRNTVNKKKVNQVIKWNEDVFLSCGDDGSIVSYSIDEMKPLKTVFRVPEEYHTIMDIAKISPTSIMVLQRRLIRDSKVFLVIVDYETGEIIKNLDDNELLTKFASNAKIVLSRLSSGTHVYLNSETSLIPSSMVNLVNFEKGDIEKIFGLDNDMTISSYKAFVNQDNEELLIIATNRSMNIFIFNSTKTSQGATLLKSDAIKRITYRKGAVEAISLFDDRILFSGSFYDGRVRVFDIKDDYSLLFEKQFLPERSGFPFETNSITALHSFSELGELKFIFGSDKGILQVVRLKGVYKKPRFQEQYRDFVQRKEYLKDVLQLDDEQRPFSFEMFSIGNSLKVYKSFLSL